MRCLGSCCFENNTNKTSSVVRNETQMEWMVDLETALSCLVWKKENHEEG